MSRIATWCILGACTALAACLNSSGSSDSTAGPISFDPIAADFDGFPAMGSTLGVEIPIFSSNLNGISDTDAKITFNADGFTVRLPNGTSIDVTEADMSPIVEEDADLLAWSSNYDIGGTTVDIFLGEDLVGADLFLLAMAEDLTATGPSTLTFLVFGDETDTLPDGSATYTGGFLANVFNSDGNYVEEQRGSTSMGADFESGAIDLTMTIGGEGGGQSYSGTGSITSGARFAGTISSSGIADPLSGDFNGAFFGTDADGTAGTFRATTEPTGSGDQVIGGFTGFKD